MRSVLSSAGYGLPAAALQDRAVTAWVRTRGVTVIVDGDDELEMLHCSGVRPTQVVFRCGPATDPIRRAVNLGVNRFIIGTARQISGLAECAQRTKYVYLDWRAPLVLGDRRLKVVGLHTDVDDSGGTVEWASAAERLLCRTALLKTCGSPITRIMLSGGSTETWLNGETPRLTSVAHAVDDALRDGCERWRVSRPAVTLAPLTGLALPARPSVFAGTAIAAA
ncbi:hypothetical protein [Mycolicibacterium sp.]|uniref:hypothetical protein n=1 Tax=Mycolicibacterium sp. TaxID=2320850 RepID=UPI001A325B98|nr:hypothetical protein [Mycolicibacterium sp.]MBJ7337984.1 hypothetical protein [Mycolicibacterium sp.]